MEDNEMVRQLFEMLQVQFKILCDLERNDLLLIEAAQTGVSQEALAAAAATVRSTLYTADAYRRPNSRICDESSAPLISWGRDFIPARFLPLSRLPFILAVSLLLRQLHNRALSQACAVPSPLSRGQ